MNKLALLILLVCVSCIPGHSLSSQILFNTHPFPCTEKYEWRTLEWQNDDSTKHIRKVQVWGGMAEGNIADLGFFVVRKSDNTNLAIGNQDHYKDGEMVVFYDFSPDYILLRPHETLLMGYQCQVWGGRTGTGHLIVTAWYN